LPRKKRTPQAIFRTLWLILSNLKGRETATITASLLLAEIQICAPGKQEEKYIRKNQLAVVHFAALSLPNGESALSSFIMGGTTSMTLSISASVL